MASEASIDEDENSEQNLDVMVRKAIQYEYAATGEKEKSMFDSDDTDSCQIPNSKMPLMSNEVNVVLSMGCVALRIACLDTSSVVHDARFSMMHMLRLCKLRSCLS